MADRLLKLDGRQFKRSIAIEDLYEQNIEIYNFLRELAQRQQAQTIFKKTFEEASRSEMILKISEKLSYHNDNLTNIEDVHDAICELGAIRNLCQQIIDLIDEDDQDNKYILQLAIIIHDLIKKVRAERFQREDFDIISMAIGKIVENNITKEDIVKIDSMLMDRGFNWLIGG